ncbi:MAG: 4Fe-4S dicluster domain-containing protein, partial [Lutibacter sp.]
MDNKETNSRRKFLDKGLKLGLITAVGAIGLTKIASKLSAKNSDASTGKMELMTTDGTIIEVD